MSDTTLINDVSINGNEELTPYTLSETLQDNTINALGIDASSRTIWVNGQPYGNAYVNIKDANTLEAPIGAEIFNDFKHNVAAGEYSHAHGYYTETTNTAEAAFGQFNQSTEGSTLFSIGDGDSTNSRHNIVEVTGNVTNINTNLNVEDNLTVDGATILNGAVALGGVEGDTITINGDTNFKADVDIDKTLNVDGNTTLKGTTINGDLGVTNDTTIGGSLGVDSDTTIGGTLGVDSDTTIGGSLGVTGATHFGTKPTVTNGDKANDPVVLGSELDSVKESLENQISDEKQAREYADDVLDNKIVIVPGTGEYSGMQRNGSNIVQSKLAFAEGESNTIKGISNRSHAEGYSNTISGDFISQTGSLGAHVEGRGNVIYVTSNYSHAEGETNIIGSDSISDRTDDSGFSTISGQTSHVEGLNNRTAGRASHAEGVGTITLGVGSHTEGYRTQTGGSNKTFRPDGFNSKNTTKGSYAHAEGNATIAEGPNSHAEGLRTFAKKTGAHAEGRESQALGTFSHAEGHATTAEGNNAHSEGNRTLAKGETSHAEGHETHSIGVCSHSEGENTIATGRQSHAEGAYTESIGVESHAEGYASKSNDRASHAEGHRTIAGNEDKALNAETIVSEFTTRWNEELQGNYYEVTEPLTETLYSDEDQIEEAYHGASHSEGLRTIALGNYSHAEGSSTNALADRSHAEGWQTIAMGEYSHAEGLKNIVYGDGSHVEGSSNIVHGIRSHAEGQFNTIMDYSIATHVQGHANTTDASFSFISGEFNDCLTNGGICNFIVGCHNKLSPSEATISGITIFGNSHTISNTTDITYFRPTFICGRNANFDMFDYDNYADRFYYPFIIGAGDERDNPGNALVVKHDMADNSTSVYSDHILTLESDFINTNFANITTLNVARSTILKGSVTLGDSDADDDIIVNGDTNFKADVDIYKTLNVDGNTTLKRTTINSTLTVNDKIIASAFYESSDATKKDIVSDIDIDFDKLRQIPKVNFNWKDDPEKKNNIGTIAQEIAKVYPEVVDGEEGNMTVDYAKLSIIALAAIDRLEERIKILENR